MPNPNNLKPFQKNDPRINRKGRPKSYDLLHEIAVRLCAQPSDKDDDPEGITKLESIMQDWLNSKNFQKQLAVIQYAYGKTPEKIEVSQKQDPPHVIIRWTENEYEQKELDQLEEEGRRSLLTPPLEDDEEEEDTEW